MAYDVKANRERLELKAIFISRDTARKISDPGDTFSRYLAKWEYHLDTMLCGYEWSSLKGE